MKLASSASIVRELRASAELLAKFRGHAPSERGVVLDKDHPGALLRLVGGLHEAVRKKAEDA